MILVSSLIMCVYCIVDLSVTMSYKKHLCNTYFFIIFLSYIGIYVHRHIQLYKYVIYSKVYIININGVTGLMDYAYRSSHDLKY